MRFPLAFALLCLAVPTLAAPLQPTNILKMLNKLVSPNITAGCRSSLLSLPSLFNLARMCNDPCASGCATGVSAHLNASSGACGDQGVIGLDGSSLAELLGLVDGVWKRAAERMDEAGYPLPTAELVRDVRFTTRDVDSVMRLALALNCAKDSHGESCLVQTAARLGISELLSVAAGNETLPAYSHLPVDETIAYAHSSEVVCRECSRSMIEILRRAESVFEKVAPAVNDAVNHFESRYQLCNASSSAATASQQLPATRTADAFAAAASIIYETGFASVAAAFETEAASIAGLPSYSTAWEMASVAAIYETVNAAEWHASRTMEVAGSRTAPATTRTIMETIKPDIQTKKTKTTKRQMSVAKTMSV
ncbi:hypothetical protein DFJ74DRAFT_455796 [Hyaloraphidium curvatum]|nr:hypothetical protein DFJ74DRAFT_455796 [Hyaloraphidium curvatum]